MVRNYLKILAMLTMLIDHIGLFMFPDVSVYRIIGRASFPLFVALISDGLERSRNIEKYGTRILFLAIVSQALFLMLDIEKFSTSFNVLFILAIMIFFSKQPILLVLIAVLLDLVSVYVVSCSYAGYGILSFVLLEFFVKNKPYNQSYINSNRILKIIIPFVAFFILNYLYCFTYIFPVKMAKLQFWSLILGWLPVTYTMIFHLNKTYDDSNRPKRDNNLLKIFGYLFYPLHIIILFFIYVK